jgi:hypothetical protein
MEGIFMFIALLFFIGYNKNKGENGGRIFILCKAGRVVGNVVSQCDLF